MSSPILEEELTQEARDMRDRCVHDFLRLIKNCALDAPTPDAKYALRDLGAAIIDTESVVGLGTGICKCGDLCCPYQRPAKS